MKKLFIASVVLVAGLLAATLVKAGDCQVKYVGDACDLQRIQTAKPDYVGKKASTPIDMVCLTVLATHPSGLVLAKGRVPEGARVDGKVVTSWRTQASVWKQTAYGFIREICIPAYMVKDTVTLCNEENRSVWTDSDTAHLRRVKRVPASNPACLLGKPDCAKIGL